MASIQDELTRLLGPQRTVTGADALMAWECDGFTIHKARPLAVVLPETTEQVVDVVRLLQARKVAFLPRGAGTCLSGGPTPAVPSVVVELARMNKVLEVSREDLCAVVQPGVVNIDLTAAVSHLASTTHRIPAARPSARSAATWPRTRVAPTASSTG